MDDQFQFLCLDKKEPEDLRKVYSFLETIFTEEQQIPKDLIPLAYPEQCWWWIEKKGEIIGTVAAWKEKEHWHWGRLAVNPNSRGQGLGKRLAAESFRHLFESDINEIIIHARDVTVKLLLSFGGKITGDTYKFYNDPITPMIITRSDYYRSVSSR